jgi:copper chaperone CopZ
MLENTPRTFIGATTFRVSGLTCGDGRRAVIEEISRIPGVRDVAIEPASGTVTVHAGPPVDRADVVVAVGVAGYTLIP